jgi:hypothetical protein
MTPRAHSLSALILLVQSEFLTTPGLRLTSSQASRYFGLDSETCAALLDTLADAGVLGRGSDGTYVRWFPRLMGTHPRASLGVHAA